MNELMIFEGHKVEVFDWNGLILFNPYNVGECLNIKNVRDSINNFNNNQMVKLTNSIVGKTDFRKLHNTGENFLTESGVYKLIFKSRKPQAEKFQDWVTDIVLPQIRKTGTYSTTQQPKVNINKNKVIEIKEMNAKVRMANMYYKLSNIDTLSKEYKNILVSKATEVLNGTELIPLPKSKHKTYSATDIGNMFGITASMVGHIANRNNLKIDEYGEYYRDTARTSGKEIDNFRYYNTVIPKFEEILGKKVGVAL